MTAQRRAQAKGEPRAERGQEKVHQVHALIVEETIGGGSVPKEGARQDMAKTWQEEQLLEKGMAIKERGKA